MKILKLCYEYRPIGGGGGKVAESLIHQIVEHGDDVDLITMAYAGLPRLEQDGQLTIHRIPAGRRNLALCHPHEMLLYLMRAVPLTMRLVRDAPPDINHTHFIFPDGVLAMVLARTCGLRYVVTTHGSDVPGYNPDRFKFLHRVLAPLWHAVVRRAECVICPSDYIKGLLLKVAPNTRCIVIPNGIDINRFTPVLERQARILVVSRLVERKGVQFLLRALEGLVHQYEVCIVGDGPYLPELRRLAAELHVAVRFTGFVDNRSARFKELLETSSIFVFTSSAENFPVVLLEAMSAGLAIITTDDTGCSEVVGDTARKVPPKDAAAIRQALIEVMADPAQRANMGRTARARVQACYTEEAIAERYRDVYREFAHHLPHRSGPQGRAAALHAADDSAAATGGIAGRLPASVWR